MDGSVLNTPTHPSTHTHPQQKSKEIREKSIDGGTKFSHLINNNNK